MPNNAKVVEGLRKGYRHPKPYGCPDTLYIIMRQCWEEKPVRRPTFARIEETLLAIFDVTSCSQIILHKYGQAQGQLCHSNISLMYHWYLTY